MHAWAYKYRSLRIVMEIRTLQVFVHFQPLKSWVVEDENWAWFLKHVSMSLAAWVGSVPRAWVLPDKPSQGDRTSGLTNRSSGEWHTATLSSYLGSWLCRHYTVVNAGLSFSILNYCKSQSC